MALGNNSIKHKRIQNVALSSDKLILFVENLKSKKFKLSTINAMLNYNNLVTLNYYFEKKGVFTVITVNPKRQAIKSLFTHFSNADFIEREISQTFGIKFIGNPNLNI